MRIGLRTFLFCGLLLAVGLGAFVAPFASSDPDGLQRVAIDQGFADDERAHALGDGPLSDYEVDGVERVGPSKAAAGVIGVFLSFLFGIVMFTLLRRRSSGNEEGDGS